MIKMIAMDLDGTLLDKKGQIAPSSIAAIANARAQGVKMIVASGRSLTEAAYFAKISNCDTPLVCEGGTVIADGLNIELCVEMPMESVLRTLEVAQQFSLHALCYAAGNIHITEKAAHLLLGGMENFVGERSFLALTDNLLQSMQNYRDGVNKVLVWGQPYELARARAMLGQPYGVQVTTSSHDNFEVYAQNADKGKAIAQLCAKLGIAPHECACIGDGENDLPMFATVGKCVAMGNAPENVQKQADFVTDTNQNDGVARAIAYLLS